MKKHIFLVFALTVLIGSCQKEEVKIDQLDDVLESLELKNDGDRNEDGKCFYFLFPLSVNMPDGTIVSGNSRKELNKAVISWFKDNGRYKKEKISLHFPVQVNFQGRTLTLDNQRQLERIRMACGGDIEGDKDRMPCIEMLFPVSYLLPSGRTLTANNGEELRRMMTAWKEAHPDSRERPSLVYPVKVKFKGKELTLNNEREMMRVREACKGDKEVDKDKKPCFKLVFPLTYIMPDRSTITRDSREEMERTIKRWYTANKSDKKPVLQFPIQIRYKTERGEKIVDIENQRALKKAYEDCGK